VLTFAIVAVQVALLAAPDASIDQASGATSRRCAAFAKPAPGARIEGRVVSRHRKPRSGVEVRATLNGSDRQYSAVSGRDGRFTIAGFDADADVDVELDFVDPATSTKTGCSVKLTRRAPEAKLTVMIDKREQTSIPEDIGCEGLPSYVGDSSLEILRGEAVRQVFEPVKQPPPARLDLRSRDIARVSWEEDGATVVVNESGKKALQEFTAANLERPVVVTIDGMSTSRGAPFAYAVIDSGALFVSEDALRGPLCKTLEAAPQAQR
jgi:hypothetical protein